MEAKIVHIDTRDDLQQEILETRTFVDTILRAFYLGCHEMTLSSVVDADDPTRGSNQSLLSNLASSQRCQPVPAKR